MTLWQRDLWVTALSKAAAAKGAGLPLAYCLGQADIPTLLASGYMRKVAYKNPSEFLSTVGL